MGQAQAGHRGFNNSGIRGSLTNGTLTVTRGGVATPLRLTV
jgi:hypothetical protein